MNCFSLGIYVPSFGFISSAFICFNSLINNIKFEMNLINFVFYLVNLVNLQLLLKNREKHSLISKACRAVRWALVFLWAGLGSPLGYSVLPWNINSSREHEHRIRFIDVTMMEKTQTRTLLITLQHKQKHCPNQKKKKQQVNSLVWLTLVTPASVLITDLAPFHFFCLLDKIH